MPARQPLVSSTNLPRPRSVATTEPISAGIITSEQIDELTRRNVARVSSKAAQEEIAYEKRELEKRERDYIERTPKCSLPLLSSSRNKLPNLDSEKLKYKLQNNFYDTKLMQTAMCLTNSVVHMQKPRSGTLKANERIRYWISDLQQIGAESVEGYAMTGNLKDASSLYVLKAPRPPANLLHEYFIGLQLNTLRSLVPNFMYTYGGFECSPPIVGEDKNVNAWCNNELRNVQYILYENIQPSISMHKYVETCTFTQFLDKYLQIMYASQVAYEVLEFMHADLHDDNVLLRTIPTTNGKPLYIPYRTERGKTEYLKSDAISTVIDYGFSHVKVGEEHYGVWDFMPYGVYPKSGFPLGDAYKLLLMSMRTMLEANNNNCFDSCGKILRFFTSENAVSVVQKQAKSYYYLPKVPEIAEKSLFDLTGYIRSHFPEETTEILVEVVPGGSRILGCSGTDVCFASGEEGTEEIRTILGLNLPLSVETSIELYDLVPRLKSEGRADDAEELIETLDYLTAKQEDSDQIDELLDQLYGIELNLVSIDRLGIRELTDSALIEKYRRQVETAAYMYDLYQQLHLIYEASRYVSELYSDSETVSRRQFGIEELEKSFRELYDPLYRFLAKDYLYLKGLQRDSPTQVQFALENYRRTRWWWYGFPIYFDATAEIYEPPK